MRGDGSGASLTIVTVGVVTVFWAAAGISTGSTTDESNHVELDC